MKKVGILAFQGGVIEHYKKIEKIGHKPILLKYEEQFDFIDGLIIPGGESTTIGLFLNIKGFKDKIEEKIKEGLPVWGTCAGAIILSKEIKNQSERYIPVLDIVIERNAYGSQIDSFRSIIDIPKYNKKTEAVFIRAPKIVEVKDAEILSSLDTPVAVQKKNILATTFHPELTNEYFWHQLFVDML